MFTGGYDPRSDDQGNILIPFAYTASDIPFARWQMVSTKVFQADRPVVIQNVIVTHRGEVFVQYAEEINDENEYPREGVISSHDARSAYPPEVVEGHLELPNDTLVTSDEKRRYE